ncbi:MAG: bifunctional metallophosphatase/5'-nucleotidase [Betaproteobacteria bacterium]|nr:bifunctional metallophosphatase/5'-nucleotidase [Betaproteobacteria bacterium]
MKRDRTRYFTILLLATSLLSCIRRKERGTTDLRALPANDTSPTCARILAPNEYKNLLSQLTPQDPLVVVSSNDLHGHADEQTVPLKFSDTEIRNVQVGGLERLAMYLAALCRQAKGRLIYLDAGDSYQGTVLSNASHGLAIVEAFSNLGLMASTFGNHEFDFGQEQIKTWLSSAQRNFWYVSSSLSVQSQNKIIPWTELQSPRFARSVVFDVGGIKVGVAGYTTDSTALKSLPDNVRNLSFASLEGVLDSEAEPLKKQGAQVVILLSHAGGQCDMRLPAAEGNVACKETEHDELGRALRKRIGTTQKWNLVVAGHSHSPQRHLIGGTPVMQSRGLGLSLARAQIRIENQKTTTELLEPVYLCEKHFENWNGCHPDEWAWRSNNTVAPGQSTPVRIAGRELNPADAEKVKSALQPWRARVSALLNKKIATFPKELSHNRTGQSSAAACLVDAWLLGLRSSKESWGEYTAEKIDVAFLNSGALRNGIPAGALTLGKLFEIIPYDNTTHIVALTTSELLTFARQQESSPHDYLLTSAGWSVHRSANDSPPPRTQEIIPAKIQPTQQRNWLVALSTFSKTFLERAGISSPVIDTGFSVRELIGKSLEEQFSELRFCQNEDNSRMSLLPPQGAR